MSLMTSIWVYLLAYLTLLVLASLEVAEGRARGVKHVTGGDFESNPAVLSLSDEILEEEPKDPSIHSSNTNPKEKIAWHKYAKVATGYSKNNLNQEESSYCHKVALKRCGNSFMKVFQLFTFLPEEQSFQAKCASRTAFYSCLKKFNTRPCKSSWHFHIEEKFRKHLADNLWSARTCVLGIIPPRSHHEVKH